MKRFAILTACVFISLSGFSQLTVGNSQAQNKADEAKVTPVLIGANRNALMLNYGLYHIDTDNSEYLSYRSNINSFEKIKFSSLQEESDFYNYVLGLYDTFKDNDITLNKIKIVPQRNNLLGANQLVFDVYPEPDDNKSYKFTTYLIGKKAWIKLFAKSNIHSLTK